MANKFTKREMFTILRDTFPTDHPRYNEVIAGIDHELELLAKKSASNSAKTTALDKAKQVVIDTFAERMNGNQIYTTTELANMMADVWADLCPEDKNGLSNQRMTSIAGKAVEQGVLVKSTDKRKTVFRLA